MASIGVPLHAPLRFVRRSLREWARRRQGADPDPVRLHRRRIYIVPSALGIGFGIVNQCQARGQCRVITQGVFQGGEDFRRERMVVE